MTPSLRFRGEEVTADVESSSDEEAFGFLPPITPNFCFPRLGIAAAGSESELDAVCNLLAVRDGDSIGFVLTSESSESSVAVSLSPPTAWNVCELGMRPWRLMSDVTVERC